MGAERRLSGSHLSPSDGRHVVSTATRHDRTAALHSPGVVCFVSRQRGRCTHALTHTHIHIDHINLESEDGGEKVYWVDAKGKMSPLPSVSSNGPFPLAGEGHGISLLVELAILAGGLSMSILGARSRRRSCQTINENLAASLFHDRIELAPGVRANQTRAWQRKRLNRESWTLAKTACEVFAYCCRPWALYLCTSPQI